MNKYIGFFLVLILLGCSTTKNTNIDYQLQNLKVIDIKEYEYGYLIETIHEQNRDTAFVISRKEKLYDKYNLKTPTNKGKVELLELEKAYHFKVSKVKTRVSTMQQLGQFIILENDTLWSGSDKSIVPKHYVALNTVGLNLYR